MGAGARRAPARAGGRAGGWGWGGGRGELKGVARWWGSNWRPGGGADGLRRRDDRMSRETMARAAAVGEEKMARRKQAVVVVF